MTDFWSPNDGFSGHRSVGQLTGGITGGSVMEAFSHRIGTIFSLKNHNV